MRITQIHLDFWYSKQQQPSWTAKIKRPVFLRAPMTTMPSIDSCVNAHAGWRPTSGQLAASNLLNLLTLSSRRQSDDIVQMLARALENPHGTIDKRRGPFARKWLAKIESAKAARVKKWHELTPEDQEAQIKISNEIIEEILVEEKNLSTSRK
jgi:hypothetical protein